MHLYTFRPSTNYLFPEFLETTGWATETQIIANSDWNLACAVSVGYSGTFRTSKTPAGGFQNESRSLLGNLDSSMRISHYFKHNVYSSPKPAWMTELFTVYEAREPIMVMVLNNALNVDTTGNVTGAPLDTLFEGVVAIVNVVNFQRKDSAKKLMRYNWSFEPTGQLSGIRSVMTLEVET